MTRRRQLSRLLPLLGLLAGATPAFAIPPAPSFTMFGSIRFQDGRPLDTGEGIVIASRTATGAEIARGPTDATLGRGVNYALQLPMDSGASPELYKSTALVPDHPLRIQVVIGQKTYVPIAVAGRVIDAGEPGVRERFDFVLGLDSDADGLPDSWEQGLIDSGLHAGLRQLTDVNPGDDADEDGLTNGQEFHAGTYALDASDGIFLDILERKNGVARLQFLAARGRTYSIRSSFDLNVWVAQPISLQADGGNAGTQYRAEDSGYLEVFAPGAAASGAKFFKLHVE